MILSRLMHLSWMIFLAGAQAAPILGAKVDCFDLFGKNDKVLSTESIKLPLAEVKTKTGEARELLVTEIHTKDQKDLSATDLFGENSDLIIGIDVRGNTQGHTYVVINNTRVDGRMFWSPTTKETKDWTLSPGLIIRYPKIPPENMEALVKWAEGEKGFNTPTCVATACKLLYDVGKFQNPTRKDFWFPSELLKHLAQYGVTGADGQRLTPEIYAINRDVRKVWDNLPRWKSVPSFIFKVFFDPYTWKGFTDKSLKRK